MTQFDTYCTEQQARRAYNLGAPLEIGFGNGTICCKLLGKEGYTKRKIPTVPQMRGWLREQNIFINVCHNSDGYGVWLKSIMPSEQIGELIGYYEGEPQAILAGIDTALYYLESKK